MKKLSQKESIAVFVGLSFIAYIMFGESIIRFFGA